MISPSFFIINDTWMNFKKFHFYLLRAMSKITRTNFWNDPRMAVALHTQRLYVDYIIKINLILYLLPFLSNYTERAIAIDIRAIMGVRVKLKNKLCHFEKMLPYNHYRPTIVLVSLNYMQKGCM